MTDKTITQLLDITEDYIKVIDKDENKIKEKEHAIMMRNYLKRYINKYKNLIGDFRCINCNTKFDRYHNFCPNCGCEEILPEQSFS